MNERIRELFKRAGGKTSIHNLMSNPIQHREYNELWNDNIEKFAELIVDEVYDYILNATFDDEPWPDRKDVKKHFGVSDE